MPQPSAPGSTRDIMPSTALALSTHAGGTAINRFCRALGEVGSLLVLAALVTSCSSSTSPAPLR
ncbi:MAG: hypothetical protein ACRD1G_12490, partial [Acidimicrobiales bacterium]